MFVLSTDLWIKITNYQEARRFPILQRLTSCKSTYNEFVTPQTAAPIKPFADCLVLIYGSHGHGGTTGPQEDHLANFHALFSI